MHFNRTNSGARALTFRNASSRTVLVRRGETRRSSYPFYMLAMRDTCLTVVKILLHQTVTRSAKTPVFNPRLIRLRKRVREMTLTRRTMQIYKIFMNPPNNYTNNYIHQTKTVGPSPKNIIKILKIFEKKYFYRDSRLDGMPQKKYIIFVCGWDISKKNILYLYEEGILPNNPTPLLPIGDPPPGGFRFSPIARDFAH